MRDQDNIFYIFSISICITKTQKLVTGYAVLLEDCNNRKLLQA